MSTITILIDHLVGAGEHCRRDDEADGLCSRCVDNELKLSGKLNRQIGRFLAFQDSVYKIGRAMVRLTLTDAITNQAPILDEIASGIDCRQP